MPSIRQKAEQPEVNDVTRLRERRSRRDDARAGLSVQDRDECPSGRTELRVASTHEQELEPGITAIKH